MLASTTAIKLATIGTAAVSSITGVVVGTSVNDPLGIAPVVGGGVSVLLAWVLVKIVTTWMGIVAKREERRDNAPSGNTGAVDTILVRLQHVEEQNDEIKEGQGRAMWIVISQAAHQFDKGTDALVEAVSAMEGAPPEKVEALLKKIIGRQDEIRMAQGSLYKAITKKTNYTETKGVKG